MAIVKMSEFSLFAFDSDKEDLLHELQKFEYVHFTNLGVDETLSELGLRNIREPENLMKIDDDISKVSHTINILSRFRTKPTGIKAMKEGVKTYTFQELEDQALSIDYKPILEKVESLWKTRDSIKQEKEKAKATLAGLNPWKSLDIPLADIRAISMAEIFTGTVPKKLKERLAEEMTGFQNTYYEVVEEDKDNLYVVAISYGEEVEKAKESLRNASFSKVMIQGEDKPALEMEKTDEKIKELDSKMKEVENSIREMTSEMPGLEVVYDYLSNKKLRTAAAENFLSTDNVDVIRGYIPTDKADEFDKNVQDRLNNIYYMEMKEAERESKEIPILLTNSKFAKAFESLTGMYSMPRYNEVDPTPLLAPFYLAFFGMMAADVGYGLIMLIGTLYVLKKFNLKENTRIFAKFFYYLSFSVIIWGFLYGSLFGDLIPLPGLFEPAKDYNTLLILSIIFGLIHIYFALAIKAYVLVQNGKIKDALFDVGLWYLALTGAIVYLLNIVMILPELVKTISFVVMIAGMVGIVVTGGRDAESMVGKVGGGIYSLYGISGYVGDIVSYSRLMALGLAGGFIAGAVNMMAGMVAGSGVFGFIGAIVIFIIGQTFNLGLSLLGAYVHAIRLIFVEFFGKFYEGGGKRFNEFRSKPKYINLK
ncbi:MAG: V-type ATP synthase subunit I [Bacillota bacterium]